MQASDLRSWLGNGVVQFFLQAFRTCIPAQVVSFDKTTNTATITPLIQDIDQAGNPITAEIELYGVPCLMFGGASNSITSELAAGDMGLLVVCDRDIDNFKASMSAAPVASMGVANLKDGIFISGFLQNSDGLQLKSILKIVATVGSTTMTLLPNQTTLSCAGASITMQNGQIILNGEVIINNYFTFGTDGIASGNLTIDGGVKATDIIESDTDVLADGISLKSHIHNAPSGGGNTGPPE